MFRTTALVVSTCALGLLSGCGVIYLNGEGPTQQEQRTVGAWKTLRVESGVHASVVKGAPGVTLTAQSNLLPEIETFVEGTELVVRLRPYTHAISGPGIRATVSGEVLEGVHAAGGSSIDGAVTPNAIFPIEASGGSAITLTGFDTQSIGVSAAGGSRVTLAGRTGALNANASGASTVDALGLAATTAHVEASGSSTMRITASERIDGSLSGGSHLFWAGGAAVQVATTGGSNTSRAD